MTHFSKICSVNFPSDTQIKITADHPLPPEPTLEDWRDLATAMLAELARAPRANWAFIEQVTADGRVPEELPQVTDAEAMETVVAQETALAEDEDKAEVDAMLDRLEEELEGINSAAAPFSTPGRHVQQRTGRERQCCWRCCGWRRPLARPISSRKRRRPLDPSR